MNTIDFYPCSVITEAAHSLWRGRHLLLALLCLVVGPAVSSWAGQAVSAATRAKVETHPGLRSAREAAAADDSLVLLILEMTGCRNCVRLREQTLSSQDFLNKAGLLHTVTININEQQRYASDFRVSTLPDLILMTAEGEIVNRAQGFIDSKTLLEMLTEARRNKLEGKWFGTDTIAQPDSQADINELISFLGSANPLLRAKAVELLVKSDKSITVPLLIKALDDPYLGIRVGVRELLFSLVPDVPNYDPWNKQKTRDAQRENIALWWRETGSLLQVSMETASLLNQPQLRSVEEAITVIEQHDPVRLSIATAKLREIGKNSLPLLRTAIAKNSTADNQETVRILENIRWSIIIPDSLEQNTRTRHTLAWGTGEERLEAIARLGSGGDAATAVLAELADDPDSLVRENVAHALGMIGNKEALEALATLLAAKDPNTRMVAAQELGKTKNPLAGNYLSTVVTDPDEQVACVAIGAMEECKAKKQASALLVTLTDPRWRVRAAGARTLGKMEYRGSGPKIISLLQDDDPFVIKTALEALIEINSLPASGELEPLFTKYPDLTVTITKALLAQNDKTVPEILTKVFLGSSPLIQREIMNVLGKKRASENLDIAAWKPLFEAALRGDEDTRFSMVRALKKYPPDLTGPLMLPLLADTSAKVRNGASELIFRLALHYWGIDDRWRVKEDFNILSPDTAGEDVAGDSAPSVEEVRLAVATTLQQWHETLRPVRTDSPSLLTALAFWLTGDGTEGLEQLSSLLHGEMNPAEQELMEEEQLFSLIVKQLPWPQGRSFIEDMATLPYFSVMLSHTASKSDNRELKNFLNDPQRLITIFKAPKDDYTSLAISAVLTDPQSSMFLAADTPRNRLLLNAIITSGTPWAKALAISCLAHFRDERARTTVQNHLTNPDGWLRHAAIQALIIQKTDHETLEKLLAPLLHDPEPATATMAAVGLLDPYLRGLMDLNDMVYQFRYDDITVQKAYILSYSYSNSIERPFTPLTTKPEFLDILRQDLLFPEKLSQEQKNIYPVLLGQYGVLNALRATMRQWEVNNDEQLANILLIAPQLTGEEAFFQPLKMKIRDTIESDDLRNLLKYLRTTPGEAARKLRREINRRIR